MYHIITITGKYHDKPYLKSNNRLFSGILCWYNVILYKRAIINTYNIPGPSLQISNPIFSGNRISTFVHTKILNYNPIKISHKSLIVITKTNP